MTTARIATVYLAVLSAEGHRVQLATSGQAGLELARASQPDAVVLDIRMPDMDGYEVCRQLKQTSGLESVPVIFVSANNADVARAESSKAGGAAFISKPFDPEDVVEAINTVCDAA